MFITNKYFSVDEFAHQIVQRASTEMYGLYQMLGNPPVLAPQLEFTLTSSSKQDINIKDFDVISEIFFEDDGLLVAISLVGDIGKSATKRDLKLRLHTIRATKNDYPTYIALSLIGAQICYSAHCIVEENYPKRFDPS